MRHPCKAFFLFILCLAIISVSLLMSTVLATGQAPPSVVQFDSLIDQYGVVTFNHEMHTYIAKACGDCHHSHNTEFSQSCQSCHALDASVFRQSAVTAFLACRNCHGTYSPETPSMPGLKVAYHKKCFGCHVGIGELGKSPKACAEICHAPVR